MGDADRAVNNSETVLNMTRTYDAAPQRVFDAWIDPQQLCKWLGPRSMVQGAETLRLDARVGGEYAVKMLTLDGRTLIVSGMYREIARPTRLVFTWSWDYVTEGETLVTVTFRPAGQGTELTLLHEHFASAERRDSHEKGWTPSLEQLAALLGDSAG